VDIALEVLDSAAPTARHFDEVLDFVAVLDFVLHVANIDEALIAAVGCLIGENFGSWSAYT
jgi:hypothetical protein